LLPKQIDSTQNRKNLHLLGKRFSNIIRPQELPNFEKELQKLENHVHEIRKNIKASGKAAYLQVWHDVKEEYPLLYKLSCAVETIQYTSASVERLSSDMGNIVTVKRNLLSVENIEACLLLRQENQAKGKYLSKEMFQAYRSFEGTQSSEMMVKRNF